jgi:hypothetical protein
MSTRSSPISDYYSVKTENSDEVPDALLSISELERKVRGGDGFDLTKLTSFFVSTLMDSTIT